MKRLHLTREGYEKLVEELEHLKNVRRRKISKDIAHARSLGDLKENAEYHAAKEAMALNEKKVHELEEKLSKAEIIDEKRIAKDKAYLGAKLKLKDLESGQELQYCLVSAEEADALSDLISITSPVGKALLGHKVGDVVEISVPAGILKYKIVAISR
ncbi:MAG: transcription elongation factor GreA [Candidatus Omnitrophota bacterium]|nr:MAG: transcription elongation factor GreA [Candidatus Omnitrophota bacterium]